MSNKKVVKLSQIIFDDTVYPRKEHNTTKVQEYAENIERIEEAGNHIQVSQRLALIDGKHRWLAHRKIADGSDPNITVLVHDVEREKELEVAIELNSQHGQQLSPSDKQQNCMALYIKGYPVEEIMKMVSVSQSFVNKSTKEIRADEKKKRDETIFAMWLACYTEQEIAECVGVTQQTVNNVIEETTKKNSNTQFCNFQEQEFVAPLYNVWSWAKKTNETGHFGNSEQRIVDNLLYLYTKPFDIVVDPFAGGGSTIDVCKNRNRRYWIADRKPIVEREKEIRKHDLVTDGLPPLHKRWQDVSLTYLDPPYWRQAAGQYSNDATDLANMELKEFTETLVDLVHGIAEKQKHGYIALLMQPTQWKADDKKFTDHIMHLCFVVNLELENRVSCPYSTEQYNAQMVNYAKEHKKLLVISRELIIWKI